MSAPGKAITINATDNITSERIFADSPFYGQPIPVGFGTWRVEGRPLWVSDVYTKGGKKVLDVAIGLGRCGVVSSELINVLPLRIYANGQLIVDRVSEDGWENYENIRFTMYPGSSTQLPNPLIVADKGATATTAFRGLVYIVFEAFPLETLGFTRLPDFDVELSSVVEEVSTVREFTRIVGAGEGDDTDEQSASRRIAIDWKRKKFYTFSYVNASDSTQGTYLHVYDLATNTEIARNIVQRPGNDIIDFSSSFIFGLEPYFGRIIMVENEGATRRPLVTVDPLTGTVLSTMGEPNETSAPVATTAIQAATVSGTPQFGNTIVITTINRTMELLQVNSNGSLVRLTEPTYSDIAAGGTPAFIVAGEPVS